MFEWFEDLNSREYYMIVKFTLKDLNMHEIQLNGDFKFKIKSSVCQFYFWLNAHAIKNQYLDYFSTVSINCKQSTEECLSLMMPTQASALFEEPQAPKLGSSLLKSAKTGDNNWILSYIEEINKLNQDINSNDEVIENINI